MISLKNISKSFNDKKVINNLSLELPDTGLVCICGKTGSGKTTLLNILAGLLFPDNGEVLGLEKKKISYVFQDDRLLSWLSVEENLAISNCLGEEALEELLQYFDMIQHRNLLVSELSGGMKRKVDLIKAMLYNGDVFMLDEPFNGIDDESKDRIIRLLREEAQTKLIIYVTHNENEIAQMGGEIIDYDYFNRN